MLVRFITPSLRCFDDLKSEAMSVPFFSDERPPRGALGMVDWRLGGRVSSLLGAGRICGNRGETVLIPARLVPFSSKISMPLLIKARVVPFSSLV